MKHGKLLNKHLVGGSAREPKVPHGTKESKRLDGRKAGELCAQGPKPATIICHVPKGEWNDTCRQSLYTAWFQAVRKRHDSNGCSDMFVKMTPSTLPKFVDRCTTGAV